MENYENSPRSISTVSVLQHELDLIIISNESTFNTFYHFET